MKASLPCSIIIILLSLKFSQANWFDDVLGTLFPCFCGDDDEEPSSPTETPPTEGMPPTELPPTETPPPTEIGPLKPPNPSLISSVFTAPDPSITLGLATAVPTLPFLASSTVTLPSGLFQHDNSPEPNPVSSSPLQPPSPQRSPTPPKPSILDINLPVGSPINFQLENLKQLVNLMRAPTLTGLLNLINKLATDEEFRRKFIEAHPGSGDILQFCLTESCYFGAHALSYILEAVYGLVSRELLIPNNPLTVKPLTQEDYLNTFLRFLFMTENRRMFRIQLKPDHHFFIYTIGKFVYVFSSFQKQISLSEWIESMHRDGQDVVRHRFSRQKFAELIKTLLKKNTKENRDQIESAFHELFDLSETSKVSWSDLEKLFQTIELKSITIYTAPFKGEGKKKK